MEPLDPALELRKCKPSHLKELAKTLESGECWKNLMSKIPKKLDRFNYVCDISTMNPNKYHSEHYRLIQEHSEKFNITCTELLFDEWGTSGRVRPTLGHLLHLLTKAQLFRAAEYVANLINQPKPERPEVGPARRINVDLSLLDDCPKNDEGLEKIVEQLNTINNVQEAIQEIKKRSEELEKNKPPSKPVIPQIKIIPSIEEYIPTPSFVPLVIPKDSTKEISDQASNTPELESVKSESISNFVPIDVKGQSSGDLIKSENSGLVGLRQGAVIPFLTELLGDSEGLSNCEKSTGTQFAATDISSENISEEITSDQSGSFSPALDELLDNESQETGQLPVLSALNNTVTESDISSSNIPDFSMLGTSINKIGSTETGSFSAGDIPDLSMLGSSLNKKIESKTEESDSSGFLPAISALQKISSGTNIPTQTTSDLIDLKCPSPLPQLSFNTRLPHISYSSLQVATNNFNESPFAVQEESGRLLGSGAFGSVFIGFCLQEKPVAIKKLKLDNLVKNVESVDADDTVSRQFRNEVEVLSKYKHDNLLSLLGYSCDGCTYCLMYEYVPGGALKDKLQMKDNALLWKDRLNTALGTAKAISYLHTGFETPLIHRDIKSANILLDCNNNPKLCDFGLIKLSPSHSDCTTTIFGTSAYMAPEAFSGDISVKMDTFSFGVVVLELLTSLPPMDVDREERDLCTHIRENCENDNILPFLDQTAGSWAEEDVDYATELFNIALKCLEIKKKRPLMIDVRASLEDLTSKLKKIFLY